MNVWDHASRALKVNCLTNTNDIIQFIQFIYYTLTIVIDI